MSFLKGYKITKHSHFVGGLIGMLFILSLIFVSCGESKGHFKIEGRFLHINSGQLFVYSPDGVIDGMDTINIEDGRFAFEIPCHDDGILMIVFPNYSQQPVFAESGGSVEIKADASHLREMEITGTKTNELMTKFRKSLTNVSPPEETRLAAQFVKDNPESPVSIYLTRKYFVDADKPDYKQASTLVNLMIKSQKATGSLTRLKQQVDLMSIDATGNKLPSFNATDVNGKAVSNADLNAQTAIISVWATWSYESLDAERAIADAIKKSDGKIKAISICLDASKNTCLQSMKNYDIDWPVICDGTTINSKLMQKLGLSTVPENIIIKNGRISDSHLNAAQLRQKLNE